MSHLWVNHNLLGIWYIRREITLTAEMHTERIAWHIVNHKHKFPLHWLQCRFYVLFQHRKNLILYYFFLRKAYLCLKVSR